MRKLLWQPTSDTIKNANITRFIKYVNDTWKQHITDYSQLHVWSVENISDFWEAIWNFVRVIASQPYDNVVENLQSFPPETNWYNGSKLNFAENLLRYRDDKIALLSINEQGLRSTHNYKQLFQEVMQVAISLKKLGVTTGDRVVGYMPNISETVIAMLAATTLGATWSSCGAELGAEAAFDRLNQVNPKVLFSIDGYTYKGKEFNQLEKVQQLAEGIQTLEKVIILPYINDRLDIASISKSVSYYDFKSNEENPNLLFEQLPFSHPLYIMFSSGTTGKPKCMVQSAGGVLINHLKELVLHTDLKRGDNIFYLTSPSWMMWNWLISSLAVGSTITLYDGNPLYPDWKKVFQIIEKYKVTIFGCSASYLHYLKNINSSPKSEFNLSSLREISQTGSPLSEEGFDFVYSEIKKDLHFNSISGGTDINGCFAAGAPILPVYNGELQALALGMSVKAYNDEGEAVYDEQGELVCEYPSPSMPIYFWNDENNKKYTNAYFNYFPKKKVWRHGDYVVIHKETGGITFYGRSDAVLKPSGVRIGTSEIYNIVEEFDEIEDSLAIGQQWKSDQRIILFVKLNPGYELTDELIKKICKELRKKASPRHVPQIIKQTPGIPYTFSGKKVESAVTNIINGRNVTNRNALANPESLDFYSEILSELQE